MRLLRPSASVTAAGKARGEFDTFFMTIRQTLRASEHAWQCFDPTFRQAVQNRYIKTDEQHQRLRVELVNFFSTADRTVVPPTRLTDELPFHIMRGGAAMMPQVSRCSRGR